MPEKYYSTSFYNEKQTETLSALQWSVTKDILRSRISEDTLTRGKDFKEGSLPIWTFPSVCEILDQMQVVVAIGLSPRWLKANFIRRKSQNEGELREKSIISSI